MNDSEYGKALARSLVALLLPPNFFKVADVAHQQTCPTCGRKLVNTYRRGKEYRCRRCWESADAERSEEETT